MKMKKAIAALLVTSMFVPNIAFAEDFVNAEEISGGATSAISYGTDKLHNIISGILLDGTKKDSSYDERKTEKFKDPGMELSLKDMQALYDMGYEPTDVDKAIELAPLCNKTPYELLQLKGQKKYIPTEAETQDEAPVRPQKAAAVKTVTEEASEDDIQDDIQGETPEYDFAVDETTWDSVLMDLSDDNMTIDENQWEYVKLAGLDKLIDESMLSEEEKAQLDSIDVSEVAKKSALMATSSSTAVDTLDLYNKYIFPKSVHEQINQGGYDTSDDISANELTGNNIVKSTDVSLPGRNGLDLNLTRYYSVTNANDRDPIVGKSNTSHMKKTYTHVVIGNPEVTIEYNEPLADGRTKVTKVINGVYIAPRRTNYNTKPSFILGMFIDGDAYDQEIDNMLEYGIEPSCLFEDETTAKKYIAYAESGDYDYTINFNTSPTGKIKSIKYTASEADMFNVYSLKPANKFKNVDIYTVGYYNDWDDSSFAKYFDIGAGWAFDFPYIEKRYNSLDKEIYEYLHMGSQGVWQIDEYGDLVDYYLKDMQLSDSSGTFNGETFNYTLTEKTGKKYYFGTIGQLLGIVDRYGNQITFTYTKEKNGKFYYPKLTKITDSVGRIVDISYTTNKVTITVTDKNDSSQNRVIEYNKTTPSGSAEVLSSVKNAEGYITNYEYTNSTYNVSMASKDFNDPTEVTYSLLTKITYPTGKITDLTYGKMTKNCGIGGIMELPTFGRRRDFIVDEKGRDNARLVESYSRDGGGNNRSAVYDGYPTFRGINELPDDFRVYSNHTIHRDKYTVTEHMKSMYNRSYNGNWLKESMYDEYEDWFDEDITGHIYNTMTEYQYNNQELLTKETTRTFDDFSVVSGATYTSVETSKEYTYDTGKYGDILTEKINGDSNYTTTYTYDSTYHIPTTITKKKDTSTTLKTTYTLTSDKKSIATATVTENNSTKRKRAYTYDSFGNVVSEKRYTGNNNWNDYVEIAYDYNDSRSVTNKLNGVAINKVTVSGVKDADGNLVSGSSAGMVSQSYKYDWFGNPISEIDANGQTYQYQYDKIDRVTKVTNPNASTIEYTFTVDEDTNDVAVKDANGNTIKYSYDNFGELISKTDVGNNTLLMERTRSRGEIGVLWTETDYSTQNGSTKTQTDYNGLGEAVEKKVLDANDNVIAHERIRTEHSVDGMLSKVTTTTFGDTDDENVDKIQYTDRYGNVVKEETVYKDNGVTKTAVTTYTHDYLGNVKTVREPRATDENWSANQYTAKYDYDVDGNVTKETDINGYTIVNTYDGLGNLTSVKDKNGNITLNTYDNLGRLLKEQIPFQKNGSATVYATNKYYYDGNGNVTKSQTANNAVGSSDSYTKTEYQYNWQNQPVKVKGYDGNDVETCVQYYYDSVGNVLRMYTGDVNNLVINGLDNVSGATDYAVTKYAYDSMNRCISQTDAMGQVTLNTYDINGNLISTTDRNGNILTYAYDGLNNLISKSSNKTADDTYTYAYNKKGLRTSMTGGGVDTTSIYNGLGQLSKETLTDGTVKEYNYDINGNRKSFKLTKDNTVQYTLTYDYDKMNQLTKVYEDGTVKAEYTYNPDGTLKKSTYGNQTANYSYNLANLLTEVNNANSGTQISKYNYTYYVDGNQKSKSESVAGTDKGTTNYTYDGVNRLVTEQAPDKTLNYQYDSYGNRSQLSVTGDEAYTTSYTYDKNNRLRKQTKAAGSASEITDFWYDPNGNQISSMTITTGGTGTAGIGIQSAGQSMNSYSEYNSWNQLISTMQNGKTANYAYNGDGLRMSKTVDGVKTSHIWDGTNIAGDVTNGTVTKYIRGLQLISSKTGNNENFYTYNGHGDVVQLTGGNGSITKQYSYDAFGVEKDKAENDTNPFRYCGEYYDTEIDSIYLRARYYTPATGRFTTEDPIRDGLNWYSYGVNNPIFCIDPSGLTHVPLRKLMQDIGGSIRWEDSTRSAYISYPNGTQEVPFFEGDEDGTYIQNGTMYASADKVFYWLSFDMGQRDRAVLYGRIFGSGGDSNPIRSDDFKYDRHQNCTNFVSQCLFAGGFQMDSEWWYDGTRWFNYWSGAWAGADKLFNYLVYTLGFRDVSYVKSGNDIANVSYDVRPGDVIAWSHFERVADSGKKTHMGIVSEVHGDNIYYCGNTSDRNNYLLTNSDLWGDLYIIHIKYSDE